MSDFLDAILSRSTGADPDLAPLRRSRYESQPQGDAAGLSFETQELDTREPDTRAFETTGFETRAEPRPFESTASERVERSGPSAASRRRASDPMSPRRTIPGTSAAAAENTSTRIPAEPADAGIEQPIAVPGANPAGLPRVPTQPVDEPRADRDVDRPGGHGAGAISTTVVASRDGSIPSAETAPRWVQSAVESANTPPSIRPRITRPADENRRSAAPPSPPTVTVTIGRIDVRAPARARREPPRAAARPAVQSLDEYLSRRNGGS